MTSRRKLNHKQQRRVDHRQREQWQDGSGLETGLVVARFGRHAEVVADGETFHCDLRANLSDLVCGDLVRFDPLDDRRAVIVSRQDRRTELARPAAGGRIRCVAANLDRLFVVTAPEPEPDLHLLDQYLVAAEHAGIRPVIVRNKSDLVESALDQALQMYQAIGYPVLHVCSREAGTSARLLEQVTGSLCACVGQSGVGKSSLIQTLVPETNIAIGPLSAGTGTHTTTTARAYPLPDGAFLIDAPGIREFPLPPMTLSGLQQAFPEMREPSQLCRFRDCRHLNEPDCAVQAAVRAGDMDARRLASFHAFCNPGDTRA